MDPQSPASLSRYVDPDLQAFSTFIAFFRQLFAKPDFLEGVSCSEYIRAYVPRYYRRTFGPGVEAMDGRHFKWFRRLSALLSLPRGESIVDYGGGYGLDSIFLASRGYNVVFFEITPNHIAVANYLRNEWEKTHGSLGFRAVLQNRGGGEPFGEVDAILLDEVAHHIEPVEKLFEKCGSILKPGGRIFMLEPNYFSIPAQVYFLRVRGLKTTCWMTDEETGERFLYGNEHIRPFYRWNRIARDFGFEVEEQKHVVPFAMKSEGSLKSGVRAMLERIPVARELLSTHVTYVYRKR